MWSHGHVMWSHGHVMWSHGHVMWSHGHVMWSHGHTYRTLVEVILTVVRTNIVRHNKFCVITILRAFARVSLSCFVVSFTDLIK